MAEWFFRKKSKVEVERDPGWDEYFTSNRSTEESLVREAIQNSLDAHAKCESLESQSGPARVRIYYSGKAKLLNKAAYAKYLAGAAEHYVAEDCKIGDLPDGDCPFVAIEDFNTTGLTGHIDWDYTNIKKKPPYYRFFWSENQSEKGDGTRGRWGIGKVVFPIASKLRSFFAYSIREFDEPREILCGKALDWNEIQRVLVENYMVSFVRGELQVELENGDGDKVVYDSAHLENIEHFLADLSVQDPESKKLLQAFQMICEGMTSPLTFPLNLYPGECPAWQDKVFEESTLAAIREELDKTESDGETGKPVTIVVPMRVAEKKAKRDKLGEFKVVIRRSAGTVARPWFYRAGLYINRVRPHPVANFVSVVLIDGDVSDMLNQAEPPSHSEWRVNTGEFKEIYKYPGEHIDFVVKAVRRLVDRIDETEKALDRSTLKNIFFVSRAKSLAPLRKGKGAGKGFGQGGAKDSQESGGANEKDQPPNFEEMESKPKPYTIYPVKDGDDSGIAIKANIKNFKPFDLKVSFFYETLSGKVKFDENDFSFKKKGSLSVSREPVELPVEYPAANRLRVRVTEATKDFKLTVRGFDANRDLRVIPHSEELKEEADGAEL